VNHIDLLLDLERHVRDYDKIVWREPNLSGWGGKGGLGSPDLLAVKKSYSRPDWHVYEVKATQSDLLSDLRKNKFERYYPLCERLTFAVHHSVDWRKHLTPVPGVGIMVFTEKGRWHTKRAARKHGGPYPDIDGVAMSLMFGRMSENARDANGPRLSRLEAERARLAKRDIDSLWCAANKFISEKARDIRAKDAEVEFKLNKLERLQENTNKLAKEKALRDIQKLLGLEHRWRILEPKDALEEVINETLGAKFKEIREKVKTAMRLTANNSGGRDE